MLMNLPYVAHEGVLAAMRLHPAVASVQQFGVWALFQMMQTGICPKTP